MKLLIVSTIGKTSCRTALALEGVNPFSRQDQIDTLTNMALWLGTQQSQIDEWLDTIDSLEKLENISGLTRYGSSGNKEGNQCPLDTTDLFFM